MHTPQHQLQIWEFHVCVVDGSYKNLILGKMLIAGKLIGIKLGPKQTLQILVYLTWWFATALM